jgi:hypothetical protein
VILRINLLMTTSTVNMQDSIAILAVEIHFNVRTANAHIPATTVLKGISREYSGQLGFQNQLQCITTDISACQLRWYWQVTIQILKGHGLAFSNYSIEPKTGRREEGLFFAARTFAAKATSGLGTFFAGIALDIIDFPKGAQPGEVPADIIFDLGLVAGPGLMIFYLLALVSISFYQITRTGHNDRVVSLDEPATES